MIMSSGEHEVSHCFLKVAETNLHCLIQRTSQTGTHECN